MIKKIKKIFSFPLQLKDTQKLEKKEIEFCEYFKSINKKTPEASDVVLLQCVEDPFYLAIFGQIISSMRQTRDIRAEQILVNSFRVGESASINKFFSYRLVTRLLKRKWSKLYQSFCDEVAYDHAGLQHPISDITDLYRSYKCWKAIKTKDQLIGLTIKRILVGDLVNDTYLRYKPAATVNLVKRDIYLWIIIWQAYRNIRRGEWYFAKVKPQVYLTSYSTYVNHGIPVRIALQAGVRVFTIYSNLQQFAKQLSDKDIVHTKNPDNYAADFLKFNDQETKLAMAEYALSQRIKGVIDSSTAYMKRSAYAETDTLVPDVKGAAVIFLHDFFDSPHVYRNMIFPDFWEWICFTIDQLEQSGIRYFVKPHPNQIGLSSEVMRSLKESYPDLLLIPSDITNKQLVEAGMACAITVYGTVGHEMAFLGIPTIASANHPHASFDFCITAKNKQEYAEALSKINAVSFDIPRMKQQSLMFYYMHNLNLSREEKEFNDAVLKFRMDSAEDKTCLVTSLKHIAQLQSYKGYISRLSHNDL